MATPVKRMKIVVDLQFVFWQMKVAVNDIKDGR